MAVDGDVFNWAGAAAGPSLATQTSAEFTSTKTVFTFDVNSKVTLTATFLSPVYPNDLVKQSLQFSYIDVAVESSDGASHDVQIYLDVTGGECSGLCYLRECLQEITNSKFSEWASGGDPSQQLVWSHGSSNGVAYHQFNLTNQQVFTEIDQQAAWGTWFFATADSTGVRSRCFLPTRRTGRLTFSVVDLGDCGGHSCSASIYEQSDTIEHRGYQLQSHQQRLVGLITSQSPYLSFEAFVSNRLHRPTFGFAKDFGTVSSSVSNLFTIGVSQEDIVNFAETTSAGNTMTALWKQVYSTAVDSLVGHFNDYSTAASDSSALDSQIATDTGNAGGANYTIITTLAVRQVFGALAPAVGTKQTYLFLKEISSNGDSSTVDVIFPAHPIFHYLNSTLIKLLLDPLYVNQESGLYPNAYAEHDLGTFPNALGYPAGNDEAMPLEECGNMLIMTLGYAQRTGDTAYLTQHIDKLTQWAGYLVDEALIPANQISTDDFAGSLANQTNLALKGIIALKGMAQIANLTGNATGATYYDGVANDYLPQWVGFGLNNASSPPHTVLDYNDPTSHGVLYNLYADRLLGLNFVDESIYTIQSNFYPTVALEFGVPLDTRHNWVKSDWEMFAASIADESTRTDLHNLLVKWINETPQTTPYGDLFDGDTGGYTGADFTARPVVGGMFALLALPS